MRRLLAYFGALVATVILALAVSLSPLGANAASNSSSESLSLPDGVGLSVSCADSSATLSTSQPYQCEPTTTTTIPATTTTVPPTTTTVPPTTTTTAPSAIEPTGISGNWTLTFDDEFDGTALNTSLWASSWYDGGTQNGVKTSAANVTESGGYLTLSLTSSAGASVSTSKAAGAGENFTVACDSVVEFRADLSLTAWDALWIVGSDWPADGEADVAEVLSGHVTSNYHGTTDSQNSGAIPGTWSGWHTYAVERTPGENLIYYDGSLVKSYATSDNCAPEYIVMNIGRGEGDNASSAEMQVDYVRAWSGS